MIVNIALRDNSYDMLTCSITDPIDTAQERLQDYNNKESQGRQTEK